MEYLLPQTLLYSDENVVVRKLRKFQEDGPEKLHLLLDYDGTITHEWDEKGNPRPTLIATLREGNYLNDEYAAAAKALAEHYKKIEKDPAIDSVAKMPLMQEWWEKHYELLIKHRLKRTDIHRAMSDAKVIIRAGMRRILERAAGTGVPVVIMSANGLGTESIRWHLDNNGLLTDNILVVSNDLQWDEQGVLIGYKQPIIHALNKSETVLATLPEYARICNRPNVILMGDSLHDIGMANGAMPERVLSVGFENTKGAVNLELYQKTFDIAVCDDSDALELVDLVGRVF